MYFRQYEVFSYFLTFQLIFAAELLAGSNMNAASNGPYKAGKRASPRFNEAREAHI